LLVNSYNDSVLYTATDNNKNRSISFDRKKRFPGRNAEYVEGCGSTYGEKIIPITEDEAKEWVEKYLTVDEYIKIFGECEE